MANVIQMGEPKADVQSEVVVDPHEQQAPPAAAGAVSATAADGEDVPGVSATLDAAEGTNGVAAGDETVVDEVSLASCTDSKPASPDARAGMNGGHRSKRERIHTAMIYSSTPSSASVLYK